MAGQLQKVVSFVVAMLISIGLANCAKLCAEEAKPATAQQTLWYKLATRFSALYQEQRYAEAAEVAKEALRVAREAFGPSDLNVGRSLYSLAEPVQRLQAAPDPERHDA